MVLRRRAARGLVVFQWVLLGWTTAYSVGLPLWLPAWLNRGDVLFALLAVPWAVAVVALATASFLLLRGESGSIDIAHDLQVRHDRLRFTSWLLLKMGFAAVGVAIANLIGFPLVIPNWVAWLLGAGLLILGSVFGNRAKDLTEVEGHIRYYRHRLARAERRNDPSSTEIAAVRTMLARTGYLLGQTYEEYGRPDEAITAYETAISQLDGSHGPDNEAKRIVRASLRTARDRLADR